MHPAPHPGDRHGPVRRGGTRNFPGAAENLTTLLGPDMGPTAEVGHRPGASGVRFPRKLLSATPSLRVSEWEGPECGLPPVHQPFPRSRARSSCEDPRAPDRCWRGQGATVTQPAKTYDSSSLTSYQTNVLNALKMLQIPNNRASEKRRKTLGSGVGESLPTQNKNPRRHKGKSQDL